MAKTKKSKTGRKNSKTKCSVCCSPQRKDIEMDILTNMPYRELEAKYGIDHVVFFRHRKNGHIMKEVIEAVGAQQVDDAFELIHRARKLYDLAVCATKKAIADGQFQAAGTCIASGQKVLETMSSRSPATPGGNDPVKDSPFMQAYFKRSGELYAEKNNTEPQTDSDIPLEVSKS